MEIYIGRNGKQRGPFSLGQVKRFLAQGKVRPTDLAWYQGLEDWVPAGEVVQIGTSISQGAPALSDRGVQGRRQINQRLQPPRRNILPVACLVVGLASLVAAFFIISQRDRPGPANQPVVDSGSHGARFIRREPRETGQFESSPSEPSNEVAARKVARSIVGIEKPTGPSNEPSAEPSSAGTLNPSRVESTLKREFPQTEDDLVRKPVRVPQPGCGLCRGAGRMTGAQILDGLKERMRTAIKEQWKFDLLGTPVDQSDKTIDYLAGGDTEYQWMQLFLRTRAKCSFAGVTVPNRNTSYACPICDSESQVRDFIKMLQRVASQY